MKDTYFWRVRTQTPTNFWVNNVTTQQAKLGIEAGAVGSTQNPAYLSKVLGNSSDAKQIDQLLDDILKTETDTQEVMAKLQCAQIDRIAEVFMPVYEETCGQAGYVSIQANPFRETTQDILRYSYMARAHFPNIICKIPVVAAALPAMEKLMLEGIPILATEVMSLEQAIVLDDLVKKVQKTRKEPFVVYMAHIAGIFDEQLQADVKEGQIDVSRDALWQAGVAVAKKIMKEFDARQSTIKFMDGGARGLHHFTEMVGIRGHVTINWTGTADKLIDEDPIVIDRFSAPVSPTVIDELLVKVPNFKKAYLRGQLSIDEFSDYPPVVRFRNQFEDGWNKGIAYIEKYKG